MTSELLTNLLTDLAATAPAQMLKASFWVYPLVNAGHILGIALLVGAIAVLDLRLLGLFRKVPAAALAAGAVPVAAIGLFVATVTGFLLFAVKPLDYAGSSLFLGKLAVIAAAVLNLILVRRNARWRRIAQGGPVEPDGALRLAGLLSLALWTAALVLGRLVGYFL
ncbi:MAG: DUF2214 domain-containing protein [Rhodospirillales bacterium]